MYIHIYMQVIISFHEILLGPNKESERGFHLRLWEAPTNSIIFRVDIIFGFSISDAL